MLEKRTILLIVLFFYTIGSTGQINLSQYFDQSSIPFLNRSMPVKVDVKWNMEGQSQVLLNEGLTNLDEGKLLLASGSFESFVNLNYKLWIGHFYLGQTYLHMGRFKEAERELIFVTKLNPSLAEGFLQLGETYEAMQRYSLARDQYEKAVFIAPKYIYAHYKLGNLLLTRREADEADRQYKKCNKIDPGFPDAYMGRGIIALLRYKKVNDAISFFNASLKADSTFASAYFWRGMALVDQSKKDECLKDWNHFSRLNPRNQFVITMRGFLNAELGKFDDAFSDFRKTLQAINVSEDKFQGAQTPLDKRIDLQSAANYLIKKGYGLREEVFTNLKAGFCLLLMGQERQAYDYLRKAEKNSSSPALYFLMAINFEHSGNHNVAFTYYRKALDYDNDIFDAHKKMSVYYSELRRWDDAYKEINEMLRIQPGAPTAFKLRGMMETSRQNYEEGITNLNLYIKTDTTDLDAYHNRAICYSATKKTELALVDARHLISISSKNDQIYEQLLSDFLVHADTANAIAIFRDFVEANPNAGSHVEIAKLLIMQRKLDEAQAELDKATAYMKLRGSNTAVTKLVQSLDLCIKAYRLFPQNSYKDAMKLAEQAIVADESNLEAQYLKAKCYLGLGEKQKAVEEFLKLKQKMYRDAGDLYEELTDN